MKYIYFLVGLFCFPTFIGYSQSTKISPEATEFYEPVPQKVTASSVNVKAPSDAMVLFNGNDLSAWESEKDGSKPKWKVEDGVLTVNPGAGSIKTKQSFGDIQLHLEWRSPAEVKGEGQGRGNSGVYIMNKYEVQILDSYNNDTYTNGQAASIYKQSPPLVNASVPPGEWNSYDIIFTAPRFNQDGGLISPAKLTVFHNGTLVQNNFKLRGPTEYTGIPNYTKHQEELPLHLQDHGNPVSFRNIWLRKLN